MTVHRVAGQRVAGPHDIGQRVAGPHDIEQCVAGPHDIGQHVAGQHDIRQRDAGQRVGYSVLQGSVLVLHAFDDLNMTRVA